MQWQPGKVYSVRLKGEVESHLLEDRFGASRGDRFVDEFSPSYFFTDASGKEVEYLADQIASVVTLEPETELVVDLTDDALEKHQTET